MDTRENHEHSNQLSWHLTNPVIYCIIHEYYLKKRKIYIIRGGLGQNSQERIKVRKEKQSA